jgi:putative sigma-54 modulation protein
MNLQIHAKDITLNDRTRAHVESAVESLKKYKLDVTTTNINIAKQKQGVLVEFDCHIAHAQPVVISQSDASLETAIDLALERASKAFRRLHDKVVSKGSESIKDLEVIED